MVYLNRTDIAVLLGIGDQKAGRLYKAADKIDAEQLASFRIEPHKVRTTTVCKLAGVNLKLLQMQIKNADAVPEQSASCR